MKKIAEIIAEEINQPVKYVLNVIELMDEGNTIPFIARYRKEAHGAMDDTSLRKLEERLKYLRNLEDRKQEIIKAIEGQEKMTEALMAEIEGAVQLSELEDIYRPYKQKRRTRASAAKEKGLEPLAMKIWEQQNTGIALNTLAAAFLDGEKGAATVEEALQGASDIIAEMVSDSAELRKKVRGEINGRGAVGCKMTEVPEDKQDAAAIYDNYKDFSQPIGKIRGYQVLALNRGEKEGFLKVKLESDRERILALLEKNTIKPSIKNSEWGNFIRNAVTDGYDRLMGPSLENEIRNELSDKANEGAIYNFALNLKPLLMQPPVKGKVTMGLDPGYRMGCKVAVVDATGKVLDTAVVYPTHGDRQKREAIDKLSKMIKKHNVEHIAIGNGTASRETEQMTAELIAVCPGTSYMVVSEAGASVYSASVLAAEEFPQYDVNLRSAISIARRLEDPLAELVKIDPKSIGVGQYQHDVPQKRLDESLDAVVEDCVNAVGVDVNTASSSLLKRVAGLNGTTAKNIVAYREENGPFTSRSQLKKVPKLGPKAFEQCAGFLRVAESKNILDNTGVHPESYAAAEKLLEICGYTIKDVKKGGINDLSAKVKAIGAAKAAAACSVGIPTLNDIAAELQKPGRDPRESLPAPIFRKDLLEISDLKAGMVLTGTVRNVIDFGAFIDIGVHQDGLVHISEIAGRFISHPSEVLSVGQDVKVVILDVDTKKKRISLSIKQVPAIS